MCPGGPRVMWTQLFTASTSATITMATAKTAANRSELSSHTALSRTRGLFDPLMIASYRIGECCPHCTDGKVRCNESSQMTCSR